jgi:hypothetical protein
LAGVEGGVGVGADTVCGVVVLPSLLTSALKEKIMLINKVMEAYQLVWSNRFALARVVGGVGDRASLPSDNMDVPIHGNGRNLLTCALQNEITKMNKED